MYELFLTLSGSLTALVLCIAAGFVSRKTNIIDDSHVSGMTNLLIRITLPCIIFMSMMREFSPELLFESIATFVITAVLYIISGYMGLGLAKIMKASPGERQSWQFGTAFGNVAFMGIPVTIAVFGYDAVIYVSMAAVSFALMAFTFGLRMFDNAPRGIKIKELVICNPALPAALIGFIFFLTGLRLPQILESGVDLIGGVTTPLSMMIIGAILARQSLKNSFIDIRLLPPVALKLIVVPLLTLLAFYWIIPSPLMLSALVLIMSMPPGTMTVIFAEQYKADPLTAARFVVVGTMLSVVTIPIILLLVL